MFTQRHRAENLRSVAAENAGRPPDKVAKSNDSLDKFGKVGMETSTADDPVSLNPNLGNLKRVAISGCSDCNVELFQADSFHSRIKVAAEKLAVPADGNYVRVMELAFNVSTETGDLVVFGDTLAAKSKSQVRLSHFPTFQSTSGLFITNKILPVPHSRAAMLHTLALVASEQDACEVVLLMAIANGIPEAHLHFDYRALGIPESVRSKSRGEHWTHEAWRKELEIAGGRISTGDQTTGPAIFRVAEDIPALVLK